MLDALERPLVLGPMAGGPGTPELAAAVSDAGGLGFLPAGYRSAAELGERIARYRALTAAPFGVNLFLPGPDRAPDLTDYRARLVPEARALGVEPGEPRWSDDEWPAKLALLLDDPVPVVSTTFGCPPADAVRALRGVGSVVIATVTTPDEADEAAAAGVDALCVQGTEAGGHQASFDNDEVRTIPLLDLLAQVRNRVPLPLVAAGGIMRAEHLRAVLDAGAVAGQAGTAFLRCPEAGTRPAHRDALVELTDTAVTRAFSGRWARGLVNRFLTDHDAAAPAAYPHVHYMTAPLRATGAVDVLNLWAGTRHGLARERPAAEVVAELTAEPGDHSA
ncbi:NAD(P)H-dependent flavin oxidoreductase [Pseudonocardia kunmingensis]|uniref:NAD(P)H-dependent flavin oxidoreductase n=1 Tax=Pseudonocardia kunmingensis TaxID=630975 RepID=UPI003CCC65A2